MSKYIENRTQELINLYHTLGGEGVAKLANMVAYYEDQLSLAECCADANMNTLLTHNKWLEAKVKELQMEVADSERFLDKLMKTLGIPQP